MLNPSSNEFIALVHDIQRAAGTSRTQTIRRIIPALERLVDAEIKEAMKKQGPPAKPKSKASTYLNNEDLNQARRGYFRLPVSGKSRVYESLERSIGFAAKAKGLGPYAVATSITYFLQAIADEMARGQAVRIPGFGMFAPVVHAKEGREPYVQARFIAARSLRNQVRTWCSVEQAQFATTKATSYRRSHHLSSQPDRKLASTRRAMDWLRGVIRNEGGVLAEYVR